MKIHLKDKDYWTIDSTPLVGPNGEYCLAIGFTDGRTICPLRTEGAQDRAACELWRGGIAKDGTPRAHLDPHRLQDRERDRVQQRTGRAVPDHHPNGAYTAKAFRGGLYKVCTEAGACAQIDVDRNL